MKKWLDRLFLIVLALALLAGGAGSLAAHVLRPQTVSEVENRRLEAIPALSRSALWSEDYFTDLDTALGDHFLGRTSLIKLDTQLDMALGRPYIHGVVQGDGVIMAGSTSYNRWDLSYVTADFQALAADLALLQEQVQGYGGTLLYVALPQQQTYFYEKYPAFMDDGMWRYGVMWQELRAAMGEAGVPLLDGWKLFEDMGRPEGFYSASDHHYTYRGMLEVYRALLTQVNAQTGYDLKILGEGDLVLEDLPNPFLGSQNRKLFGCWPTEEKLTLGRPVEDIPFTRTDNGTPVAATHYYLPQTDDQVINFSLYMGGDVAETVIETNRPELPSCLVWGDSFTNPLETVLWASFDETRSLDLRHYKDMSLSEYIELYRPDVVICLRDDGNFTNREGNGRFF